jgi:hypothetical protein
MLFVFLQQSARAGTACVPLSVLWTECPYSFVYGPPFFLKGTGGRDHGYSDVVPGRHLFENEQSEPVISRTAESLLPMINFGLSSNNILENWYLSPQA